ncbi:hypothetical protein [Chitinolyticbacter meiyuanensis]|uniref:hypothetical protein n=1 Tax=Chitinolyticbacter meiyuanensis TaxID=682798 RepID=UPI0011E5EF14|nr:hypothetical protein [Chitinolyticbacter meiyuanensis]
MSTHWTLGWAHGEFTVQALGGMLAPVRFWLANGAEISPLQVAPWQPDPALPGVLRGLRGEWPCLPFGMSQSRTDLPAGWQLREADDGWDHGYCANHEWQRVDTVEADALTIAIDYPAASPVARLERTVRADPDAPALTVTLTIHARRDAMLPFALHPTFTVPADGLELVGGGYAAVHTYPVPQEPGISRITADCTTASLAALPTAEGPVDHRRLPLPYPTEELVQLADCRPPFVLRYPQADVALDWDASQLPDALLWFSNGGRRHAPWHGRHFALGIEPANSVFDLARVATPPQQHPLAGRHGLALQAGVPMKVGYRLSARLR